MALQNLHNNRQDGYNSLRIVGNGGSLREKGKTSKRVVASNGGHEWRRLVAASGDKWWVLWNGDE